MAKIVRGPLFSQSAQGSFARGKLIFRRRGGQVHVYRGPDPAAINQAPASPRQVLVREVYAQALSEWQALSVLERAALASAGSFLEPPLAAWALYLQSSMRDFGSLLATDAGGLLRTDAGAFLAATV